MLQNPILKGFYPDPSICRVGNDFYMVTSSFSYFPGVPVFHSKDLMHWEQIGHVLDRKEQLHVTYEDISLGIFAPTIRYNNGTFYMITTNMTTHENFFCTATDPAGPWSNPVVIRDATGIDPSLFFDDDGKVYFTGTSGFGDKRFDHQVIACSEIDLTTGQLVSEQWVLGDGAAKGAISPEAPHLYKKDGWYYLIIAEGGTEHYHAVTVSRSRSLHAPFENFHSNPILTHRHLGKDYPICNVGHGDLVELPDGSWYMVCLATRLIDGYHKLLGRETFIVPVVWEDDWPVVSPGTGKVEWTYPAPNLAPCPLPVPPAHDDFKNGRLSFEWNYLGTPYEDFVHVTPGKMSIHMLKKNTVSWEFEGEVFDFFGHMMRTGKIHENMPWIGKRLTEATFMVSTKMSVTPKGKEAAGIAILQNNANQLRIEITAAAHENQVRVSAYKVVYSLCEGKMHYEETCEGSVIMDAADAYVLTINGHNNKYDFIVQPQNDGNATNAAAEQIVIAAHIDGTHLGTESAGGFVGAYAGLYATSGGEASDNHADFTYYEMLV